MKKLAVGKSYLTPPDKEHFATIRAEVPIESEDVDRLINLFTRYGQRHPSAVRGFINEIGNYEED